MRHAAAPRRTGPAGLALVGVLLAVALTGATAVVAGVLRDPEPRYDDPRPSAPSPDLLGDDASPRGLAMLRDWDAARAAAWADGEVEALAALYTAGSAAGERDVAMLRSYLEAGLRVEDMSTQVLRAELRRDDGRRRVLHVTDRVVGGAVTDGTGRTDLPTDTATEHVLTWRRVDGEWLLESVAGPGDGDRSGLSASRSR